MRATYVTSDVQSARGARSRRGAVGADAPPPDRARFGAFSGSGLGRIELDNSNDAPRMRILATTISVL